MTMTRAEKAHVLALTERANDADLEVAVARALSWSRYIKPEKVPSPEKGWFNGWYASSYDREEKAVPAWSAGHIHSVGSHRDTEKYSHASQDGRALYATKLDALIALRLDAEAKFAVRLAKIDADIAREREEHTP